jgi:alkylhydroperoxidase family enzyme
MRESMAALVPANPRHPLPNRDPSRPKGLNILGVFARHPELARAYNTFNGHVLFASTLAPRERELLVLRVGVMRGADYEWAQHVVQGRDAGLSDEEIERVTEGPNADGWAPSDAALLAAADELVRDAMVSDETWAALAGDLDEQQLLDVVFTVGAYDLLAMAMRSCRIELDDDLIAFSPQVWRGS